MKSRLATAVALLITFLLLVPTAQAQDAGAVQVRTPVQFDVSPELRDIDVSALPPINRDEYVVPNRQLPVRFIQNRALGLDPALQAVMGQSNFSAPLQNFDALDNDDNSEFGSFAVDPPDPNIEVGEEFIVEMVNLITVVYDKQGTVVDGPFPNNAIWNGFGGACEAENRGDPIVLYDQDADRWLLSQFARVGAPDALECVAVSQTSDPAGAYYRYAFLTPGNDYPKLGVGTEAYYLTYRDFSAGFQGMVASALDRDAMIAGDSTAAMISFGPFGNLGSLLPADADGELPSADTPHPFAALQQDATPIYEFDPDFDNPDNSTFEEVADLDVDPFDSELCGAFRGACIPQPDGPDLESLSGNLMHRLQLRTMGGYNAMVVSHTVDADGNGRAGVRWYEYRDDGSGWSVYQQGTYAPDDGENRFMPSIAMNADGAIALGYSLSSETTQPAIRYTGRPDGAPLGQMTLEEQSIFESSVSKTGSARWGDYSAMVVDAADGSTFWYNNEYGKEGLSAFANWGTRIASFAFDTDDEIPPGEITDLTADPIGQGVELTWTAPADDAGEPESGPVNSYDIRASTEGPIEDSLDFENAIPLENPPVPAEPGTEQTYTAQNLEFETQYWFAVLAVDDNGNRTLSNSPSATTGPAPEIAVSPDEFDVTLEPFETETEQLTITNNGGSTLEVDLFVDYAPEDDAMPEFEFFYTEDFPRSELAPSTGAAPGFSPGTALQSGPGITPLDPVGSSAYGINAASDNFSSFDLGEPEDINVIAPAPTEGGFPGAGTIGPDPTFSYAINGQLLFKIDNNTGEFTEIGEIEGEVFNDFSGMTYDPSDSTYYAVDTDIETSRLYTIVIGDTAATATLLGEVTNAPSAIALAIAGDGNLYTYTITTDELVQVDKVTGEGTVIGSIGFDANFGQGMSYDAETDELYMAAFNATTFQAELRVVDTSTGATTLIGPIGDGDNLVQFGWIGTAVPEASGYIALGETMLSIEPGSSEDVEVTFDASGLDAGTYNADIVVQSNDPDSSEVRVPATLTVEGGEAVLAVNPDELDFGTLIAGATETQSFAIINEGNLDLTVTDISVDGDDAFELADPVEEDSLVIPAFDSVSVAVTFAPEEEGTYTGTVTVETAEAGTATVELEGEALPAPGIEVEPDSLFATLMTMEDTTKQLFITNTGESTLEVDIRVIYENGNMPEFTFEYTEDFERGTEAPSIGQAPMGRASSPAPGASVVQLDPVGVNGYGAEAANSDFVTFDLGEPEDLEVLNDLPSDDFPGAGTIGPDPATAYGFHGSTLYSFSTDTGEATEIGSVSTPNDPSGLTYDAGSDTYYMVTTDISTSVLYTLDVESVEATEVGEVTNVPGAIALSIAGDGNLYTYGIVNDEFVQVNKNTGEGTVIGSIGFDANFGQGMGYDEVSEELYMAAFNSTTFQPELRVVDISSGATTLVGVIGDGSEIKQLGWLGTGVPIEDGFLTIEPRSASIEPDSTLEVDVTFSADSLETGLYTATILIDTNIPDNPTVEVPATLEVLPADYPFELEPDEIELTIDLTEGDSTATREVTITNTTDSEQSFEVLVRGVSGDAPVFQNFRSEGDRLEFARKMESLSRLAASGPTAETSMGVAPERARVPAFYTDLLLQAEMGTMAYSTSVFGDFTDQFVQFDLTEPSDLMPFGDSPTSFAGDFAPGSEEVFYLIEFETNILYSVDKETGETTEVGTAEPNGGESWSELAGDPTSGTLYGSAGNASGSTLYTIDEGTGEVDEVAPITTDGGDAVPFVIGIAIDGDGQMYGYEIANDTWLEIDKESGEAEVIGPIGFNANFAQGLDYDLESGTMYMAACRLLFFSCTGELRTVDLETGNTTLIGPLGENGDELGYLALPSGGFMFVNPELLAGTLAPGGSVTFDVNFDASGLNEGEYEAEIVVVADVFGEPEETIPVTLEVIADPDAELEPMALDFGEVFVNADSSRQITLMNTGQDDLEVEDIQVTPDVFFIADSVDTDFTLEPGESVTYTVTFMPDAVQEYTGTFTVISDDPDGDVSATLTGEGIAAPAIAVNPDELEFQLNPGEMETQILEITNTGGNPLTYAIMDTLVAFTPADSLGEDDDAPNAIFQDTILEEDFNDGIPSDWTVVDSLEGGVTWTLNDLVPTPDDNYTGGDGTAAHADSDDYQFVAYDTRLVTPSITAEADDYELTFRLNYQHIFSDTLTVDITTDGGASWTNVMTYAEDVGGFRSTPGEMVELSLAPYISEGEDFQVRWRYYNLSENAWDWYAQVDDVMISRGLEFLTVEPASGTLAPGETDEIEVMVDATDLPEGLYEVNLNITTNDPLNEELTVPVDVFVGEGLGGGVVVTPEPGPDSTRTVSAGETFLVPITVSSLDGLDVESYEFTLTFAEMLLEPIGVETEGTLSEDVVLAVNTEVPGQISVAAADTTNGDDDNRPVILAIEGEGTLLFVRLQATTEEMGTTELAFTNFQFNEGEPEVMTQTTSIEVGGLQEGDVSGDGTVSAFDANLILEYVVGLTDLDENALEAADVSDNGTVSAFDAALVFDFVLGRIDCFPSEDDCDDGDDDGDRPALALRMSASQEAAGTLAWGEAQQTSAEAGSESSLLTSEARGAAVEVPLSLAGTSGQAVRSVQLTAPLDLAQVAFEGIEAEGLPEGWEMAYHVKDGVLNVAMAGPTPLQGGRLATLKLRWLEESGAQRGNAFAEQQLSLGGESVLNEAPAEQLASADVSAIPAEFAVSGNYPNPFGRRTEIALNLPKKATVSLVVYDVLGRQVMRVEGREMAAGTGRTLRVNGAQLPSGTYLYRITAEMEGEKPQVATGRMVLVK